MVAWYPAQDIHVADLASIVLHTSAHRPAHQSTGYGPGRWGTALAPAGHAVAGGMGRPKGGREGQVEQEWGRGWGVRVQDKACLFWNKIKPKRAFPRLLINCNSACKACSELEFVESSLSYSSILHALKKWAVTALGIPLAGHHMGRGGSAQYLHFGWIHAGTTPNLCSIGDKCLGHICSLGGPRCPSHCAGGKNRRRGHLRCFGFFCFCRICFCFSYSALFFGVF